ncbi:MAG: hypothetical protein AAFU85_03550 [Planctomycetota bacterium]
MPVPFTPPTELVFLAPRGVLCFGEFLDPNDGTFPGPLSGVLSALTAQQTCIVLSRFRC